jgi:hypothetical protein
MIRNRVTRTTALNPAPSGKMYPMIGNARFAVHPKKISKKKSDHAVEFQTAGILEYSEDLKLDSNADIGPKDCFEIGYSKVRRDYLIQQRRGKDGETD